MKSPFGSPAVNRVLCSRLQLIAMHHLLLLLPESLCQSRHRTVCISTVALGHAAAAVKFVAIVGFTQRPRLTTIEARKTPFWSLIVPKKCVCERVFEYVAKTLPSHFVWFRTEHCLHTLETLAMAKSAKPAQRNSALCLLMSQFSCIERNCIVSARLRT